jgi:hypothetical protein
MQIYKINFFIQLIVTFHHGYIKIDTDITFYNIFNKYYKIVYKELVYAIITH